MAHPYGQNEEKQRHLFQYLVMFAILWTIKFLDMPISWSAYLLWPYRIYIGLLTALVLFKIFSLFRHYYRSRHNPFY